MNELIEKVGQAKESCDKILKELGFLHDLKINLRNGSIYLKLEEIKISVEKLKELYEQIIP